MVSVAQRNLGRIFLTTALMSHAPKKGALDLLPARDNHPPTISSSCSQVEIDYETGQVKTKSQLVPRPERRVMRASGQNFTALSTSSTVVQAQLKADPAVLHLDVRFLSDIVVLSLATAFGGLLASALRLPHTLGFILGGMIVGPSCLDYVVKLGYIETLAQFGSIFLLFSHGLMYSEVGGKRLRWLDSMRRAGACYLCGALSSSVRSRLKHLPRPMFRDGVRENLHY